MNSKKFQQLLPCSLVLKGKYNADNEFQKVKARLVVLGNLQKTKYDEIFGKVSNESPTVSLTGLFSVLVSQGGTPIRVPTHQRYGTDIN